MACNYFGRAIAGLFLIWCGSTSAQKAPQPADLSQIDIIELDGDAVPEMDSPPVVFEDVTVTATKRPQHLSDLPATVTVIDAMEVERNGADGLQDYLTSVPGVGFTPMQPDFYRISVRGMQTDAAGNTAQTTGIFIDDIPLNDASLADARPDIYPFDLSSVEVLKGPQGTLFGGSALAGAVRYSLADAEPGVFTTKTFARMESVSEASTGLASGLAVNWPVLGNSAALRLVGTRRFKGGMIDDLRTAEADTDSSMDYGARALFRWDATEKLSFSMKAMRQRTDSDDVPFAENDQGRLQRERALRKSPSLTTFNLYALDVSFNSDKYHWLFSNGYISKFSNLSNAYGARALGIEALGQPVGLPTVADIQSLTHELRVTSFARPDENFQWTAGLFAHHYQSQSSQLAQGEIGPTGLPLELMSFQADISAQELAAYGEASYLLKPGLEFTFGGRFYEVRSDGVVENSGLLILPSGSAQNRNDARIRSTGLNPKLAVLYSPQEYWRVYGSIARGFRFGGIQIIGPTALMPDVPTTYDPDSVWSYELGFRSKLMKQQLNISGSVYYNDWRDPQIQTTTDGPIPFNVIDNVGAAKSVGAEVTINMSLARGLTLTIQGALTDASTTKPFTASSGELVASGSRLVGHPDQQYTAKLLYQRDFSFVSFRTGMQYVYTGQGVSDILQSKPVYGFSTLNMYVLWSLSSLANKPELSLGIRNVFDERAVVSAFVVDEDNFTTVYNRPRTTFLRLSWVFG